MKGIDVSYCQDGMDFQAAANAGVEFAIIRLGRRTDGGWCVLDTSFIQNINSAIAAGLKVGVYFYTKAINEVEAAQDAEFIKEMINEYCQGTNLEMGIWYDVEDNDTIGGCDKETITGICSKFICTLNDAGYKNTGIYSSYSWLTNKIDTDALVDYVPYWTAQYNSQDDFSAENPTKKVKIWQHTDHLADDLPYDGNVSYDE